MLDTDAISATEHWLSTVVIGHQFCPFARQVQEQQQIHFAVFSPVSLETALAGVIDACIHLNAEPAIATSLLIYPDAFNDFSAFLDLVDLAERLLHAQGYEGIYQLASFHPEYCFADATDDDPANYTNRSPYPMLHLLRESSIEQALRHHPDPDSIPANNIKRARQLGLARLQAQLLACHQRQ